MGSVVQTVSSNFEEKEFNTSPTSFELSTEYRAEDLAGRLPAMTETSTNTAWKQKSNASRIASSSSILAEIKGTIMAVKTDKIRVKLEDTEVDFPSVLFESKSFARSGQPVKYQIKRDQWGYRYQDFVADESAGVADTSEFDEILKDI